jgi:hypothetical protein
MMAVSAGEVLRIFDLIKIGAHGSLVEARQAKSCVLELEEQEGLFNVDGEVVRFRGGRIAIDCVPGAFKLFAALPR